MIRAGIVGATGYMGGELLRILQQHPNVDLAWACARHVDDVAQFHPNLYQSGIQLKQQHEIDDEVDLVFLALPTAASIRKAEEYLHKGIKVIDLGAAYRLKEQSLWERIYQMSHNHWHLTEQAVYGINELYLEQIQQAALIANPGCFSSAAILGLAPLVEQQLIKNERIAVTGISGSAGIGAELSRAAHHAELGNNLIPYNVVDHRHSYEMEQELSRLARRHQGDPVTVQFTPVYAPITRGILCISHVQASEPLSRTRLLELYRDYYRDSRFVKIYDVAPLANDEWHYRPYPWLSSVTGSNYCFIGMDYDPQRDSIVILSVLDSIGKGGAQVAVENMNLMFSLPRDAGLCALACHP